MKTCRSCVWVMCLVAAMTPVFVVAQGGPPAWAGQGRGGATAEDARTEREDDFAALDRFLAMSDAELDQTQQAIARVRAMTPAERAALRAQIAEFRQLSEGQRQQIRGGWGWQSAQDRDDWRAMMQAATAEERAAVQRELHALPADQRVVRRMEMLETWRAARAGGPQAQD